MERYYYKAKDGTGFLNLKSPKDDENYIEITEEEFEELTKPPVFTPTAEQKAEAEKAQKIAEYKKYLADTDYIVIKIAEAIACGDSDSVAALQIEYLEQLKKRQEMRELINNLEA